MKLLSILFVASLFTGTAFAAITDIELIYTTVNGSVAPQYIVRTECKIANGNVTKITTKKGKESAPKVTKVKWTGLVENEEELGELLKDAADGKIVTRGAPIGGSFYRYNGSYKSSSKLKEVPLRSSRDNNTSNAAKTLILLIDKNC